MTSVLQIGTEPPRSTILDIFRKGSCRKNEEKGFQNGEQIKNKKYGVINWEHVVADGIHTLLEKMSLFSKREQRNDISTAVLELTVSSA